MSNSGSFLRWRITAAYVVLACVICGCFAAASYASLKTIENNLVDKRLIRTADRLLERYWRGLTDPGATEVSFYSGEAIPPELRSFAPGIYEVNDQLHVLVRDDRGVRFVLTEDESEFESIERYMSVVLALAFLVCLVIAWIMGRLTASKVIAPVTELAQAVGAGLQDLPSMQSTDEMGVLARAFAARTKDLQDVLTRERWFTADVSHELRTPLTVMLGASEVLAADETLQPWSAAAVERIRRVALDASERVSAMLLLSRAPETMGAPRVALRPIVQQELEEHRHLLEGKPVQLVLEAEGEVHVFARRELVAIAIGNLVRNACQFTEAGTVLVRLESARIVVEDTGPGLPPRITQRLFERFVHADTDAMAGSGLGLAIVHRVIDHLGWSIALEGKSGGGTRFVICFKPV